MAHHKHFTGITYCGACDTKYGVEYVRMVHDGYHIFVWGVFPRANMGTHDYYRYFGMFRLLIEDYRLFFGKIICIATIIHSEETLCYVGL